MLFADAWLVKCLAYALKLTDNYMLQPLQTYVHLQFRQKYHLQ